MELTFFKNVYKCSEKRVFHYLDLKILISQLRTKEAKPHTYGYVHIYIYLFIQLTESIPTHQQDIRYLYLKWYYYTIYSNKRNG
jgi:hypothetical protein